jgi:cobalt-zinc-cadmium efflux system protein
MEHHHHNSNNLKTAFFLNLGFTLFEAIGGFYVNSVAILSDAVHDLGDSISLGLSWYLHKKSQKSSSNSFSFGYARFSLLGALINAVVLIAGTLYVISEAVERLFQPETSNATGMLVFALVGVAVNGYAAYKVSAGKSLNERVVSWHLLEDVLGWVAVLIVAIILHFYQTPYLDPALSLLIAAYVLFNVVKRLKETLYVFLQGVPQQIEVDKLKADLLSIPEVEDVHHLHLWSLDGEKHVLTTHVKLKNIQALSTLLAVKKAFREKLKPYPLEHHTIEVELKEENCRLNT